MKVDPDEVPELVLRAISFAACRHAGQLRKDRETPYAAHPMRVMFLLSHVFRVDDAEVLAAGVLHDTVEDTATDRDEIAEAFGERVASIVAALSKDKRLPEEERESEYFAGLGKAAVEVKLCKLADTLDNLIDSSALANPASLETDPTLLALWVHYLRWRGDGLMGQCLDELADPLLSVSVFDVLAGKEPERTWLDAGEEGALEARTRVSYLEHLGVEWFLGQPLFPGRPDFRSGALASEMPRFETAAARRFTTWITRNWFFLRFDPAGGRCVLEKGGGAAPGLPSLSRGRIPRPETPLPGWRGRIPPAPHRYVITYPDPLRGGR